MGGSVEFIIHHTEQHTVPSTGGGELILFNIAISTATSPPLTNSIAYMHKSLKLAMLHGSLQC
jgi:hypothetical protein